MVRVILVERVVRSQSILNRLVEREVVERVVRLVGLQWFIQSQLRRSVVVLLREIGLANCRRASGGGRSNLRELRGVGHLLRLAHTVLLKELDEDVVGTARRLLSALIEHPLLEVLETLIHLVLASVQLRHHVGFL